jgi:hypothetical protein
MPSASGSVQTRPLQQSAADEQVLPAAPQLGAVHSVNPSPSASVQPRPLQQSAADEQALPAAPQSTSKSTVTAACPLRRMFNVSEAGVLVWTEATTGSAT